MFVRSQKARIAILGTVATVGAFFVFRGGSGSGAAEPIDAVPKESFLVATVDVAELRRSPIYEPLFGKAAGGAILPSRALSLESLEEACGFDPFTRIERLALSVPEKEGERDFGLAARVQVSTDELRTCKRRLDEKRGGDGTSTSSSERGSFVVFDTPASGGFAGRLAYGRGNLLVVSRGEWFDAIVATANGARPSVKDAPDHAKLRSALTSREAFRQPTVVVTAVLPRALRDRVRGEMLGDGQGGAAKDTKGAATHVMAGVLGVASVGFAVRAGPPGGTIDLQVDMTCDSEEACVAVDKLIQKNRLDWSKDFALRLVGLGAAIDSIQTKQSAATLRVTASANADALAATLERVMKLRGGVHRDADAAPASPFAAPRGKRSDETIPSKPDAKGATGKADASP